jgi:hypothetical protein
VTDAANLIDRSLRISPLSYGVVHGTSRVLNISPLEIDFRVSPPDRLVEVLRVSHMP